MSSSAKRSLPWSGKHPEVLGYEDSTNACGYLDDGVVVRGVVIIMLLSLLWGNFQNKRFPKI